MRAIDTAAAKRTRFEVFAWPELRLASAGRAQR
jgi:hypothetical protein